MPLVPPAAEMVFGDRLGLAEQFVALLATTGTTRGLIGPRERDRLWSRHVIGGALLRQWVPERATVIDVGSGAGLPGVPLAIARPDLRVECIEPLRRRTDWLQEAVDEVGLTSDGHVGVGVHTGRAESLWGELSADVVTARAVASLEVLLEWTRPLIARGGSLVAIKGQRAEEEVDATRALLERLGCSAVRIETSDPVAGVDTLDATLDPVEPLTVVIAEFGAPVDLKQYRRTVKARSAGSARRRTHRR